MKNMTWIMNCGLSGLLLLLLQASALAVPGRMHIQGKLVDRNQLVNGIQRITFSLYSAETRGSLLHAETADILVVDGLYEYELGQATSAEVLSALLAAPEVWLETEVAGETLTPRQRLNATPYALVAHRVPDGSITHAQLADDAVDGSNILDGSISEADLAPGSISADLLGPSPADTYAQLAEMLQPLNPPAPIPHDALRPMQSATNEIPIGSLDLGGPVLTVRGFTGHEALNEPFAYCLLAESGTLLNPGSLVGEPARFLHVLAGTTIEFNGIVGTMALAEAQTQRFTYIIKMVPDLEVLRHRKGSAIFQELDTVEIIQRLFQDAGLDNPGIAIPNSLDPRRFVMQYNESELQFIRRLMEQEGIFYAHTHTGGDARVRIGHGTGMFENIPRLNYLGHQSAQPEGSQTIYTLQSNTQLAAGQAIVRSREPINSPLPFEQSAGTPNNVGVCYIYEGRIPNLGAAAEAANIQSDRLDTERAMITGTSSALNLRSGARVVINDTATGEFNGTYHILSVRQSALPHFDGTRHQVLYANVFTALPSNVTYRPARVTPRPVISGVNTAIVTGPAGEDIHTDEHGRVKVKFPWIRNTINDDTSSAWIRVAQMQARGSMFLPRVGWEVLVSFEDGDPDRPVIIGRLWNGIDQPPRALPDNKFQTIIGTQIASDGTTKNEILMDDTSGSETMTLTAKDLTLTARNDLGVTAARNADVHADNDLNLRSGADLQLTAAGNVEIQSARVNSAGAVIPTSNLGNASSPTLGARYRDNALLAWAKISAAGAQGTSNFGVRQIIHVSKGRYTIVLNTGAASAAEVVAVATPEIDGAPTQGAADARMAMIDQLSATQFEVYIIAATGSLVDNDFMFMVTGR